jgi:hypothetical protein
MEPSIHQHAALGNGEKRGRGEAHLSWVRPAPNNVHALASPISQARRSFMNCSPELFRVSFLAMPGNW